MIFADHEFVPDRTWPDHWCAVLYCGLPEAAHVDDAPWIDLDTPRSWTPAPLTGREAAEAAVAGDVAGQVEAAPWESPAPGPKVRPWLDSWLTAEDRKAWRP